MRAVHFFVASAIFELFTTCAFAQHTNGASNIDASQAAIKENSLPSAKPIVSAQPLPRKSLPALTEVKLEIGKDLGSKTSKPGDIFPIRLHEPITLDGREIVPAGTLGVGEVVEAKPAAGSGVPGILILAARYLDISGRPLRLRSIRLVETGENKVRKANNTGLAMGMILPIASAITLFISGNEISVPQGTVADAKTAADFPLP